ncbi:MAG: prephenate dehydrogenase/arogenate dehydrogenase family protein [Vallitaleaceae bacterium]|jgi:prephenate dehydrogenase|nr:prephenate dehydrogenase/arogenate dehydrogenase family protein [Vallitaleaceae bacterium]
MFKHVGIIGLGLIGGSLAKAIKKYQLAEKITAYNRSPINLEQALSDRSIDMGSSTIDNAFKDCDIIFLCLPVDVNIALAKRLELIVSKDCIITDVSSTKTEICQEMKSIDINFIGGHPMTGSEKTGYIASNELIFENAYYIYTKDESTKTSDIDKLIAFTETIKAIPIIMDSNKHDFVTASISHVPHVIASGLVNIVKQLDSPEGYMHDLAAGGFKSITRIASSSPDVWQQICASNKDNVVEVLDLYINYLTDVKNNIQLYNPDYVYDFFNNARDYRDSFIEHQPSSLPNYYAISIDVFDQTGIIAKVATELSNESINIKNIGVVNNREHVSGILEIVFYEKDHMERAIKILESEQYKVYTF